MKDRVIASMCAIGLTAVATVAPARAAGPQTPESVARSSQTVQPAVGGAPASAGIVFVDVTPDTITTIRTAQNLITRVALPREAKQAICGDLFDAATNTGSFVVDHNGNDVFIKPIAAKGQTNLFIKTDQEVYNFDLVVVPSAQAYRVVNVNLPSYEKQIEDQKAAALREIDQQREQLKTDMEQQLATRQRELEQQAATDLAAEQKKLRAEADRRAADMATRRFVDGVLQGFTTVPLRERKGQFDGVEVQVDDVGLLFEGRLYVRFRVNNRGEKELVYQEPKLLIQNSEKSRPLAAMLFTARGDYKVPAGAVVGGVAVFEMPTLEKGERLVFVVRGPGRDRVVQLRLIEQQS